MTPCVCCGAPLGEHTVLLPDPPPLLRCPRSFLELGRGEPVTQRWGDPITREDMRAWRRR